MKMKKLLTQILFLMISLHSWNARAEGTTVFADFLVWQASQQTSSTWASVISSSNSNKRVDFDATNVNFGWKNGFRGGFLHELQPECWTTGLSWTYFPTKATTGFSIGDQIVTPEFFSSFVSGNIFTGANLKWKLTMNMVDFELGRILDISETFAIRPLIGIKGGSINQKVNCQWNAAGFYTATEKLKHNFSGVGPNFGIESKWKFYNNLSLFGDFSTALMWGRWKVSDTYSRPAALFGLVTPTTITTSLNNSKLGTLMYRCRLGLEWKHERKLCLTFQLGYELQFWANQLRMPTFQQLPVHGDLTVQGATCQLRIDF